MPSTTNKSPYFQRDKEVDPTHTYSHSTGTEDYPNFLYKDKQGNYLKYTNAPKGHGDHSKYHPEPVLHPSEPLMDKNPEFFTPNGKKLIRAPYPDMEVEWNKNYNPEQESNLWAGRWTNPETGGLDYTYLDSDFREHTELAIHKNNLLTDSRLPILRQEVVKLSQSQFLKDRITALGLALIDQGMFLVDELCSLVKSDIRKEGDVTVMRNKFIFGDHIFNDLIKELLETSDINLPFFSVPMLSKEGEHDEELYRRLGPHYFSNILESMGIPLIGIVSYHATKVFVDEVHEALKINKAAWGTVKVYALRQVAIRFGVDFSHDPNYLTTLNQIDQHLIDPIISHILEKNATAEGYIDPSLPFYLIPDHFPVFNQVSMSLSTKTEKESILGNFLHSMPLHEHLSTLKESENQ